MIRIGDKLPGFSLEAYQNGEFKTITDKSLRGKWVVIAAYPADFTFICPTELEDLAKLYKKFQAEGAEVLGLSTDTHFTHKAWHDSSPSIGQITYPMLADPTGKLCKKLGTYIKDEGLSLRGTFIFNTDGELTSMEIHDNSIGRNAQEILRKLQASIFVSEHDGEVCPANWTPGSDTLKPGIELVGKI